jgi:hypothetical protein
LWLFGSARSGCDPRDIDLLLVYDPATLSVEAAIELRTRLAEVVFDATRRAADVLLLSQREVVQTGLLQRVDAVRI